jgi:hypothetical protein
MGYAGGIPADITQTAGRLIHMDEGYSGVLECGNSQIDELQIHWPAPSKHVDKLNSIAASRYLHLMKGRV